MSFERIPFPQGNTPQQLYSNQVSVVRELRRIFEGITAGADTDLTTILADIAELREDVDALIVGGGGGGSGLTPQQQFELSLVTATNDVLGSLSNIYERLRTRFETDADATILAVKKANEASTGLKTEVRVRIEEDIALAERIDSVFADLGVTNAQVNTLAQAVVDGDEALATQITSLQSTVAGNTAEVQVLTASINGIETRFAVQINNNNEVTGFIRLDGNQQGSVFTVAADKFQVSQVGTAGGAAKPVFAILPVAGVSRLAFRGDMFADGTINARMIQAGAVTADKITANSLAAITANLGTIIAGLIRDAENVYNFNLGTGRIRRTDGTFDIDMKNKVFEITF